MATEQDLNVFARLKLAPFLKEAVQAAVVERPSDTIDFVIQFLTKNKDNLQRGMIAEAISYVNAGGKLENDADVVLLKQYEATKKKLDAVTNVGRAEVARLKDLNTKAKRDAKELVEQLESANAELEAARARIAELEASVAAAAAAAAAASQSSAKSPVSEERGIAADGGVSEESVENAPMSGEAAADALSAPRVNPFQSLSGIDLDGASAKLVSHTGEHGYAIVFGEDSPEGEPSARTQFVETAAAALTAAGVAVSVHKIDISGINDGSAFVIPCDDGSQVPGPFVVSLQQLSAAALADPASVTWLLLIGNNGIMTLESLKISVFSKTLVQTMTGDITLPHNLHLIVETAEEEHLPLPCCWLKI